MDAPATDAERKQQQALEMKEVAERHHLHAMEMNVAAIVMKAVAREEYQLALELKEQSTVLRLAVQKEIDESVEKWRLLDQDAREFREESRKILEEAQKCVVSVMEEGNRAREFQEKERKALEEAQKDADAASEERNKAREFRENAQQTLEDAQKDAEAARKIARQVTPKIGRKLTRLAELAENRIVIGILMLIGAGSSAFFPSYLTAIETRKWICGAIAFIVFIISSIVGFEFRYHAFMRTTHGGVVFGFINLAMFSFTAWLSVSYTTTERSIGGFLLLATSVFCWLEIVRPTYDYGVLSLFMNVPLQVAVIHYRPRFNISYIYAVVVPVFYLTCQGFFARLMDLVQQRRDLLTQRTAPSFVDKEEDSDGDLDV